ncbi:recombinase family protein [Nocardioides pacificus]
MIDSTGDTGTPTRALIYSRISSDSTGEGRSNDRQEQECQRLIDYKRWETVGTERDVSISAYSGKVRPGWERVLELVAAGEVDVIVAYHLDRLTRSMSDLERLIILCEEHGVSVATATGDIDLTNDTGRMVARILAAVARQEVERKAARQKLAHAQRRADGKTWSAVKAFGYSNHGNVIDLEAGAIRAGARDFLAGTALAEIARRWTDAGLTNAYNAETTKRAARAWTTSGVRKVLSNPRNAGYMTYEDEVVGRGDWTPILDETTYTLIRAKLADPGRRAGTSPTGRKASNLLTGIATCATCGETLRAGTTKGEAAYICGKWHVTVPRHLADSLVSGAFAAHAPDAVVTSPADVGALVAEIADRNEQLTSLAVSQARRAITRDQLEAASAVILAEVEALERQIESSTDVGPVSDAEWREGVFRFAESDDLEAKRTLLARHSAVTVYPKGRGKSALAPRQQIVVKTRGDDARTLYDERDTAQPVLTTPSDLIGLPRERGRRTA